MTGESARAAVEEPGRGGASAGRRRRRLGLLVGIAALGYLFLARVDWGELIATVAGCDLRRVPQILAAQLLFVALGGLALWLLAGARHDVRLPAFLAAYWRCVAVGFWTPAASGELTLAWFLRPHGLPLQEGLALVTLDKIVTTLAFAALALPAAGWMASRVDATADPGGFLLAVGLLVLAGAVLAAALLALARKRGVPRLPALLEGGRGYLVSLRGLVLASPARLAGNLALTLLRVTVGAAVLWWSVAAFTPWQDLSFARLVVVSSAARLLALVLPSPNGLGVYEVALVELLSPAHAPAAGVLAGVLLSRVIALLAIGLGLLLPGARPAAAPAPSAAAAGAGADPGLPSR